jgi:predicted ATP-grasp superfamily ATP-dependent carboligase
MSRGPVLDLQRFRAGHPPVVVLGGPNVTRACGLAGLPVIVAAAEDHSPAFASRYCRGGVLLPPLEQQEAVAGKLERLGARLREALGRAVPLFYGNDDYLNVVLRNRERLSPWFRFIVNDPPVAAALIDKERFDAFARERGLPVPRALEWEQLEDYAGPVLVKPKLKLAYEETAVYRHLFAGAGKARVFSSGRELAADALACSLRAELLLQEYVPGGDRDIWSFHGYADEQSRVLAWFTGRKIRTYPALTGASSYLELAHHAGLAELGHDLVARAPLKGVFKLDFKRNPQTGRFCLLEVNARFNLWHYLGAANGVNVPLAAYEYLLEGKRPAAPGRFGTSVRWLSFKHDLRAYRQLSARGELDFWRWAASLAFSRKVHEVFAWTDPLPYFAWSLRRVRRLPRLTARLTRWLFTAS